MIADRRRGAQLQPGIVDYPQRGAGRDHAGIALDTSVDDFRRALTKPKAMAVGIAAQFVLLPAVTFLLTLILSPAPSVALGMILVACCPPGNISNVLTHRAGGDVALSVSMTAVSNVLAIFLMPLNLAFWGSRRPETDALLQSVNLNALEMVAQIALIIGVPFVLGIWAARRFPEIAAKAQPWVKNGSLVALLIFIVAGCRECVVLRRLHRGGTARGLPARHGCPRTGILLRRRHRVERIQPSRRLFRGRHPQCRAGAWPGVHVLRRSRWHGRRGRLVGIWDIIAGLALATIWSSDAPEGGTGMTVALVTGGNGFLGTAVIDALIAQGITVVCVDLTVKDTPDDRIRRVRADVCDPTELGRVFGQYRPNVVIHLASIVNPGKTTTAEQEYRVDVDGTRNVLAACVEHGVGRIVVSSSERRTATTPTTHRGSPRTYLSEATTNSDTVATNAWSKRCSPNIASNTRSWNRLSSGSARSWVSVDNQITALFDRRKLLKVAGSDSPSSSSGTPMSRAPLRRP
ncbi:NAD-dependent epimerase/dehydratase family protein [Rhodococcus sp. 3Y1]